MLSTRTLARASARAYTTWMPDPLEHATGKEKRELLAHMAGNCDPFHIMSIKRGPGKKDCPNIIPSAFNKRLVGCVCHPHASHVEYMWLHEGQPKRCGCGHWFQLCRVPAL
ncbi:cytochrome c oxidase subunit 5B, mitochondrial-like [Aricia agestis]|uniref:cytochrome c oxidase subunit 5B, mitochondrial-like n=1 Tax=Aricia agestis TaxID=91739 RepID=UPI001C201CBC|nr:cytochrome c oxidase subunit 5B, mitochondrial-like [Aricia agestis]XP_041982864.1 cytochrome c oxidase subunit 5B, mitochondrial-like [Aricia agestis]XP_041982865.1 cytochrome c oxidase subunit 5B, mitochondrial-like [Aricia agestis]